MTMPRDALGSRRPGPHPVADVFLALLLLAADAVAALVGLLWSLDAAGADLFGGDLSDADFTPVALTLAVVALGVLGTALFAGRARAYVTAGTQALAGLVLLLVAAAGMSEQHGRDDPPAPEPGYSGPHAPCLSGGDTSECNGS
ncbi:DUF6234 family protein [Streptomyces sp. NPDC052682]|uniref:DUF6234 family protein n=1 Tax=Streptomyces sp. NPDC052682 TaxID=3154954 RepID=UPI00343EEA30